MVLDMTPYYQAGLVPESDQEGTFGDPETRDVAYMRLAEEARGCGILDCGATRGVSSMAAADQLQCDRLAHGEPKVAQVSESNRSFKFGEGSSESTKVKITQPVTAGPLSGESLDFHLVDTPNNDTPPLIGVDFLKKKKAVVDFDEGRIKFKGDADSSWHKLPRSERGLLLVPLTEEA